MRAATTWAPRAALFLLAAVGACGDESVDAEPASAVLAFEHVYVTSTTTIGDEQTTYATLLKNLDAQTISLENSREFPGWGAVYPHDGSLFVTGGDAPTMQRYSIDGEGNYVETGAISFLNEGARFAESGFVAPDKAFVFSDDAIVWNPKTMEITGRFPLPQIENRPAGLEFQGITSGRSMVVRGNRTYVATSWANWDDFAVSEDSLIIVIDNERNEVIGQISVPCPYVDIATLSDDGYAYFSNWVYSVGQTLLSGKKKACAVRIAPDTDVLDPSWSLTFADITGGREAAAMRYIGNGKAVVSVFHHERVDLEAAEDPSALANNADWNFWVVDLAARTAVPLEGIAFNAGGAATERVDGRTFMLVPSGDYASTTVYEILPSGTAEVRWMVTGWSTQLSKLR